MDDFFPLFVVALGTWFAGYEFGFKRGEKRGRAVSWDSRPPITYVELPCFGGPRDGETVKFQASCEQLRMPYLDRPPKAYWEESREVPISPTQSFIRQAMYRRLWIGDREQLVYQGTVGG